MTTDPSSDVVERLRDEFARWLKAGPNSQPHHASGMRPFSTGDLKAFVAAIERLSAELRDIDTEAAFIAQSSDLRTAERGCRIRRIIKGVLSNTAENGSNECPSCLGRGERYVTFAGLPRTPDPILCDDCCGTGQRPNPVGSQIG